MIAQPRLNAIMALLSMRSLFYATFLCLCAFTAVRGQRFEITPVGGYLRLPKANLGSLPSATSFKETDTTLRGDYSYGLRFTWNTKGYYGHEFGYILSRAGMTSVVRTTEDDVTVERQVRDRVVIQEGFYNFMMYFMPAGEWWRPFATIGGQTFNFGAPSFPEWEGGSWRNYGVNYGAGIKLKAKALLFRIDFRDYVTGKPYGLQFDDPTRSGGLTHNLEGSVGVGIAF